MMRTILGAGDGTVGEANEVFIPVESVGDQYINE